MTYLQGVGLVFMVFSVGAQVIYVNGGKAGDQQFQFLLVEDGDEALWNDVIETFQEGIQSGERIQ